MELLKSAAYWIAGIIMIVAFMLFMMPVLLLGFMLKPLFIKEEEIDNSDCIEYPELINKDKK